MLSFIHYPQLFCIAFGLVLFFSFIMSMQALQFYTKDVVIKKFSIMDLEIPGTPEELVNLIKGLYLLPDPQSKKTIRNLKGQLYIDFLFMPSAYGAIFLLCMLVSGKMLFPFGIKLFIVFGWLQLVPWICDIIENIYLLRKIKPEPVLSTPKVHKAYLIMEIVKWGISLAGCICAMASICYFWLTGNYSFHSLYYLMVITCEIALFLLLGKFFLKKII